MLKALGLDSALEENQGFPVVSKNDPESRLSR
jgi:hypothetical protein